MSKPLSDEEVRILRAVAAGRMTLNDASRYVIAGEPRPDRKARERLTKRDLIDVPWRERVPALTAKGRDALAELDAS